MGNGSVLAPPALGLSRPRRRPRLAGLVAHVRAHRLDRDLATGAEPWRSSVHAARSLQLTSARSRRGLARALDRLARDAGSPRPAFASAVIKPCRTQVGRALPLIRAVSERLRSAEPLNARGIASLNLLLSDGDGPCYAWIGADALAIALEDVSRWLPIQE